MPSQSLFFVKLTWCWIFTIFVLTLHAQHEPALDSGRVQSAVSIHPGIIHSRFIDEGLTFNRLPFKSTTFLFDIGFTRLSRTSYFACAFNAAGGKAHSFERDLPVRIMQGQIAFDYSLHVADVTVLNMPHRVFCGARIGSMLTYADAKKAFDNEVFQGIYGLQFNAHDFIRLNDRRRIHLQLSLPMAAYVKRLVIDGGLNAPRDESAGSILFEGAELQRGRCAQFAVEYFSLLTRKTEFRIVYRLNYISTGNEMNMSWYSSSIGVGFNFHFVHG
jgi:hypothetical protein